MIDDEEFSAPRLRDREPQPLTRVPPGKRPLLEGEITAQALRWLNKQPRTHAWKLHSSVRGQTGHPDIDACVDGRSLKIEMKRPGKKPEPHQIGRLKQWRAAGAIVGWASSLEHVQQLHARAATGGEWANPLTGPGAP